MGRLPRRVVVPLSGVKDFLFYFARGAHQTRDPLLPPTQTKGGEVGGVGEVTNCLDRVTIIGVMAAVIDSVVQVLLVGVLIPLTAVLICYQQPLILI